jgi:hypothetical protein
MDMDVPNMIVPKAVRRFPTQEAGVGYREIIGNRVPNSKYM